MLICSDRKHINGGLGKAVQKSIRELLKVKNISVNFLDCGDGFICAQTFHIVHFKYEQPVVC